MRLDPVCDLELRYDERGFELVQPFGGEEGAAYGTGEGRVTSGAFQGRLRWSNHPRRRSDGTMQPDVHGVIYPEAGGKIMFDWTGRTPFIERAGTSVGVQVLSALFETDIAEHAWLNDAVCVIEGAIDPVDLVMRAKVFACINEMA
jgi:hypothetical protein